MSGLAQELLLPVVTLKIEAQGEVQAADLGPGV